MKIDIRPGKYVVGVSGGVDSMVLLDLLANSKKHDLIIAHFDHGMRSDSGKDRKLVAAAAKKYGLPFVSARGNLGAKAGEALARDARYDFLKRIMKEQGARAIVTAHHQDDMLETAILNLLRGTGRRGLSSLKNRQHIRRPLLKWTKKDVKNYAEQHDIKWREDSTNEDERFLRNYIRRNILVHFGKEGRDNLLDKIRHATRLNQEIDDLLDQDLKIQPAKNELSRAWYLQLPYAIASEMMATWLRKNGIMQFDRHLIERLVIAAKTANPGKLADINANYQIQFSKDGIKLIKR